MIRKEPTRRLLSHILGNVGAVGLVCGICLGGGALLGLVGVLLERWVGFELIVTIALTGLTVAVASAALVYLSYRLWPSMDWF